MSQMNMSMKSVSTSKSFLMILSLNQMSISPNLTKVEATETLMTSFHCNSRRGYQVDHFPHFFGGSRKCGKTPFGFYSYKTPSIRHYHECIDKKGESVWDSHGYWRCLFPNSEVPNELLKLKNEKLDSEILTKEDFNNALNSEQSSQKDGVIDLGEKGIHFKQFTDFLNWKSIMYENVKREKEKKRQELIERRKQQAQEWKGYNAPGGEMTKDKSVISSSVQSNLSSNMDSNECVLNETRTEYYNDGTSCTKTITKSRPIDAKDWVNVTENVEHNNTSNGKNGWFWNSKDNQLVSVIRIDDNNM